MCPYSWRVPLTTFGTLTVLPAQSGRILSDEERVPTTIEWRLMWNLASRLPWAVFLVVLAACARSDRRTLWVVLPVVAAQSALAIADRAFDLSADDTLCYVVLAAGGFVAGLGVLWLLLRPLSSYGRLPALLSALTIPAMMGVLAVVVVSMPDVGMEAFAGCVLSVLMGLFLTAGMGVAARTLRRDPSPTGFACRLLLVLLLVPFLLVAAVMGVASLVLVGISWASGVTLTGLAAASVLLGATLFALTLPFLVLTFRNECFHARFCAFWGVEEESTASTDTPLLRRRKGKLGQLM